jgi:hypothetical protein
MPHPGVANYRDSRKLSSIEAAAMPQTRADLIAAWKQFKTKDGLKYTSDDEEFQNCESHALTYLERLVQSLRMTVSDEISSEQAWTLAACPTPRVPREGNSKLGRRVLSQGLHDSLVGPFWCYLRLSLPFSFSGCGDTAGAKRIRGYDEE